MLPPFLIVHRSGAEVVMDETVLHPLVRRRMIERRKHSAFWWASNGAMIGVCMSYAVALAAQGGAMLSEWTQPSSVMAVVTLIFAGGQMWNARMEDRRRITKLEDTSVTKEAYAQMVSSIHSIEAKLDRLIMNGRNHET
jgi:hypothetical protein